MAETRLINKKVYRPEHLYIFNTKASPHAPYMAHEAAESLLNIYLCPDLLMFVVILKYL